jgi:2-dehydro-3-deoxyphosphooctonate aldolase (KDO 8-P synthase)
MNRIVNLGNFALGVDKPLIVFAGLCALEDENSALKLAGALKDITVSRGAPFVFKASFDKANRTALNSYRGPGLAQGLAILQRIKTDLRLPVLVDIHQPEQAAAAAAVVDVLQIPAFLCRQTDLLVAAGRTGKPVNIKKGQFLAPNDMRYAAEKVLASGGQPILTERGTTFGYGDLVVDMRSLVWMRELGYPVIFDGTHSVQRPGAGGGVSGGLREMVAPLCRAAAAVGIDGLYLEVHHDPDHAPSDGQNSLSPDGFAAVLDQVLTVRQAVPC